MRKSRKGLYYEDDLGRISYPSNNPNLTSNDHARYTMLVEKIEEIRDWVRNVQPDIASYSPEQAIQSSDEWHQMMAGKGEGVNYEPTKPELIMYGPEWRNPEWQGWTIQRVMSENDLLVEGNKQNNCVGSYCENVQEGFSIIYSLRDPGNNPKATMETDDFHNVKQIQGNSNSIPAKEYRAMIKEWIESDKNTNIENYEDDSSPFDEISTAYGTAEEILEAIERTINDDYGLGREADTDGVDIMNMAISIMNRAREPSYWGDNQQIPEASIDMILQMPHASDEWKADKIKELEQEIYKKEEEIWDWATSNWDMSGMEYPNEEDYETSEEFEAAEEKHKEEGSNYMSEELRKTPEGGYTYDAIAHINKLREQGMIPSYEKMNKIVEESNNKIEYNIMNKKAINWFQREKFKGTLTREKLKERLNYLSRKKDKIIEFNKPEKWQYYRKSPPDTLNLDKEIENIKQQLYQNI